MTTKLERGGGLVVGPLVEELFFAASLTAQDISLVIIRLVEQISATTVHFYIEL